MGKERVQAFVSWCETSCPRDSPFASPAFADPGLLRYKTTMIIAVLQQNPTVGDIEGNADRIVRAMQQPEAAAADLCLSTEMALTGYPPRDLLLYSSFVERCQEAALELAERIRNLPPLLLGSVVPNDLGRGKLLYNCALLLENGRITRTFRKTLLPTYDVFDEDRYFEPVEEEKVMDLCGMKIAVTICEDVWNDKEFWQSPLYRRDPLERIAGEQPDMIVNLSASPFSLGKQAFREAMLGRIASKYGVPFVYANQVGGNDDLVFDGRSCVFDPDGNLAARAKPFEEDVLVVDTEALPGPMAPDDQTQEAETWAALVTGTRDYARKAGFQGAVLGLSGGIDSALTATVAAYALGAHNVTAALMPSPHSSPGSVDDSTALAETLGLNTHVLPIAQLMQDYGETLALPFAGLAEDITEENIQARIRGNLVMALSNKFGLLALTTGNKSEVAVGYCTIYGDMAGGLAPIADVPKTHVYALARWINKTFGPTIPESIITKPPSAELRPGQIDQDSLPPYEVLDEILFRHLESHQSVREIAAAGFDRATVQKVLSMVAAAEFKRKQAAPGLKITNRAFGSGWRMPIAARKF